MPGSGGLRPRLLPLIRPAGSGQEDRSVGAFADGLVDGLGGAWRERDRDNLAALAGDSQGPVAALDAQRLDVGACGLGHPQPVER